VTLQELQNRANNFNGNNSSWNGGFQTSEGRKAVDDAIGLVQSQQAVNPLEWSDSLAMAAKMHCNDIGPKGLLQNLGSDGRTYLDRMAEYGTAGFYHGENLSYGPETRGQNIVLNLLIDDGNSRRGNRSNMLRSNFKYTGIATCTHSTKGKMTVINYAETWSPNLKARLAVEAYAALKTKKQAPVPKKVDPNYWNCHKPTNVPAPRPIGRKSSCS